MAHYYCYVPVWRGSGLTHIQNPKKLYRSIGAVYDAADEILEEGSTIDNPQIVKIDVPDTYPFFPDQPVVGNFSVLNATPIDWQRIIENAKPFASSPITLFSSSSPQPARSQLMDEFMTELPGISLDKKYFQGHLVVDRHTEDFDQKLASIGSDPAREILLMDPNSPLLVQMDQQLLERIRRDNATSPEEIIATFMKFIRELFIVPEHLRSTRQSIGDINKEWLEQGKPFVLHPTKKTKIPVIPIDHYIVKKRLTCRHYTLLTGRRLCKFIKEERLAGKVRQHRDTIPSGPHAWMMHLDPLNQLFLVDTTLQEVPLKLLDCKGKIITQYGLAAFQNMQTRYESLKVFTHDLSH